MTSTQSHKPFAAFAKLALSFAFIQMTVNLTSFVDAAIAGRAGAGALAAVGLGSAIFMALSFALQGLAFGIEPFVAQAQGSGRQDDAHRWLMQGVYICLGASLLLWGLTHYALRYLPSLGVAESLSTNVQAYMRGRLPSLPFFGVVCALRVYLQASHRSRSIIVAAIAMNVANLFANYLLMFGDAGLTRWGLGPLGLPPLGVFGLGLGSTLATLLQAVLMIGATRRATVAPSERSGVAPRPQDLVRIVKMGVPIASQMLAEVALFSFVGVFMGTLGETAMAAHQAVLMLVSMTFGVCVGIGDATAVQTGRALGASEPRLAKQAAKTGLLLGVGTMSVSALIMWFLPRAVLPLVTSDAQVIEVAVTLLAVAAIFQLCDGIQAVCCGALRGAGKTRAAFYANCLAHWCVGAPTAYVLCTFFGWGAAGLWWGLVAGLSVAAFVLVGVLLRLRYDADLTLEPTDSQTQTNIAAEEPYERHSHA